MNYGTHVVRVRFGNKCLFCNVYLSKNISEMPIQGLTRVGDVKRGRGRKRKRAARPLTEGQQSYKRVVIGLEKKYGVSPELPGYPEPGIKKKRARGKCTVPNSVVKKGPKGGRYIQKRSRNGKPYKVYI